MFSLSSCFLILMVMCSYDVLTLWYYVFAVGGMRVEVMYPHLEKGFTELMHFRACCSVKGLLLAQLMHLSDGDFGCDY